MPACLSPAEVQSALPTLPGWRLEQNALTRRYDLPDFAAALALVNRIGALAEAEQHHPDFTLGWGYVTLTLTTHDAGGLTQKDLAMAQKISALSA